MNPLSPRLPAEHAEVAPHADPAHRAAPADTGAKAARARWRADLWLRLRALWFLKMLSTTLGITAFFGAYFWVLHHPQFPLTVMPLTPLDRVFAFSPAALPLYFSLWLYVLLAPALLKNRRELASYGLASLMLSLVGLGIFIVWPTAIPVFDIDWSQHPSIAFLKSVDVTSNACPSLHVAFAVFTAAWLERLLREMHSGAVLHLLNGLWGLGIVYSTLATRQHVVLDVVAGALLGGVVAALHWRALRHALPAGHPAPGSLRA